MVPWLRRVPFVVFAVLLALPGCSRRSGLMATAPADSPAPADTATVVFLRPGFTGFAISAAVYDGEQFAGIVMRHARLALHVAPGQHRFMVVSEAADFLDADLAAGKEYFVLVTPRMGAWRARFSLRPVAPGSHDRSDLRGWLSDSYPVVPNAEGEAWARSNAASVHEKHDAYLARWLEKGNRPTLRSDDGVAPGSVR
jgi:hypothetical protein